MQPGDWVNGKQKPMKTGKKTMRTENRTTTVSQASCKVS